MSFDSNKVYKRSLTENLMVEIVTIEGLDYSGKTTVHTHLAKTNKANMGIVFNEGVVYPTSLTARLLSIANQSTDIEREFLYTSMMTMDRYMADTRGAKDKRIFIQDRYWPSVVAYGRFLNNESSIHRHQNYSNLFIEPVATILLSCSDEELAKRSGMRNRKSVIDTVLLSNPKEIERLRSEIMRSVYGLPNIFYIDTTKRTIDSIGDEITSNLAGIGIGL